ncbi:MAG: hypothetical protein LWY06_15000 [Firmicutes bacterium]|nr:hypothetical protein [Bacillota bacterium]
MRRTLQIYFLLMASAMLLFCRPAAAGENIPTIINSEDAANKVFEKAKNTLSSRLNMHFQLPMEIKLVSGKELDAMVKDSPYRGNVTGLHTFKNGRHVIYMMTNVGRDDFYGTMCHEMTHSWQLENCPPDQSLVLSEGLAVWVEMKVLYWDGAYYMVNQINQNFGDPIYGVGYRYMQKIEDKYGEKNVLQVVKNMRDIPPGN